MVEIRENILENFSYSVLQTTTTRKKQTLTKQLLKEKIKPNPNQNNTEK